MSDEMKNCCPPETTAPKMHAHEAGEKTEDIKPKVISTAHKRLSQDEFQRKVAMVARKQAHAEKAALAPLAAPLIIGGATLASAPLMGYFAQPRQAAANYGSAALGGAGIGGLAGALHGAFAPGEEAEYDAQGNVIGKKRRGMLAGMLRGGLAGAGMGAGIGAGAEHLRPGMADEAITSATNFGKQMGQDLGLMKKPGWFG